MVLGPQGGVWQKPTPAPAPGQRIHLLPDALIDQIAAGEVVERPASVVKELVENALDAGAGAIRVEVRDGGRAHRGDRRRLRHEPDDARLALQRHATSKIARAEDLPTSAPLASAARRCRRSPRSPSSACVTRARGAPEGFELRVEAGQVRQAGAVGAPEGTRVEVADLFSAVPARRKFLKTATTEWGHVADVLVRCALALPGVHFDVQREGRPALAWPAVDEPARPRRGGAGRGRRGGLRPGRAREAGARVDGLRGAARPPPRRRSPVSTST